MNNLQKTLYVTALVLTLFIGGVMTGEYKTFPYGFAKPFVEVVSGMKFAASIQSYNDEIRWKPTENGKSGVTLNTPEALQGYTLVTTTHDQTVRLIDMNGKRVHEWNAPFNSIFPNQDHLLEPHFLDDSFFYLRDAELFADGSILVMYGVGGLTPWGAGLVKLDKDSKVEWKIADYFYNDMFYNPDDNRIYALFHKVRQKPIEGYDELKTPFLEDNIAVIDATGKKIDDIPVIETIRQSPFANFLTLLVHSPEGDYTHTNSVEVLRHSHPTIPWLKKGYLLISMRNPSALAVIDPATKKAVHVAFMPFRRQHDLEMSRSGNMTVFDNHGNPGSGGYSRVAEFDPVTMNILHTYVGTGESPLESDEWGCHQELDNGNTLIAVAEQGRIVEMTANGRAVWEYNMPERHNGQVPVVTSAKRFTPEQLPFVNQNGH